MELHHSMGFIVFENGFIMDAGANDGTSTLLLTRQFKNHTILSVEPILVNIANTFTFGSDMC